MKIGSLSFAVVCTGVFLGAIDQTVVATLLPPIITDLEMPFTRLRDASWIVTSYLLGYTIAMPVAGRLADLRGRMRIYSASMLLFALASISCGSARSLEWLVAARALQAMGGGAVLPVALALAAEGGDQRRRAVALGVVAAVAEAGSVLGPLYSALLIQWVSWRWVFYLNLPIAVAIAAMALRAREERAIPTGDFDLPGATLLAAALGSLTLGLSQEHAFDQPAPATLFFVGSSALLFLGFLLVERSSPNPLIDPRLFRKLPFLLANAVSLLVGASLIVAMVDLPLWSATVLRRSAAEGGVLLLQMTMFIPVGGLLGGFMTRRFGPGLPTALGLLACSGSFLLLARWPTGVSDSTMALDLVPGGIGFGLLLAPLIATAIAWAGQEHRAAAAGIVTLMRMIGMMVGLSALTSYGLDRFHLLVRDLPLPLPIPGESTAASVQRQTDYANRVLEATASVYHDLFLSAALICLLALPAALLLRLPKAVRTSALRV